MASLPVRPLTDDALWAWVASQALCADSRLNVGVVVGAIVVQERLGDEKPGRID